MRLKVLYGAPLSEDLSFSEVSLLSEHEASKYDISSSHATTTDSTIGGLNWRRITSRNKRLHSEWVRSYHPGRSLHSDASDTFYSIPNIGNSATPDDLQETNRNISTFPGNLSFEASKFVEPSFVFHDTLVSSQITREVGAKTTAYSSFLSTSFSTNESFNNGASEAEALLPILQLPPVMILTPLASIPSAQHLRSIYPQTPTPNLLCVLIQHPEQREVSVKKGNYTMFLWELMVADHTRADFKVSFWLRPSRNLKSRQPNHETTLSETLNCIGRGDIVLIRNVALTSFRDVVSGRALHAATTRAKTSIHVILSNNASSISITVRLPPTFDGPASTIKNWVRAHIPTAGLGTRKRRGSVMKRNQNDKRSFTNLESESFLPPDTIIDD